MIFSLLYHRFAAVSLFLREIFAKKRTSNDGKTFYSYLTSLRRKEGSDQTVAVKFRDECGHPKPEDCPMNIIVEKGNANMSTKEFVREDTGEIGLSYTMWVSAWTKGSAYVDHSMDEFDV